MSKFLVGCHPIEIIGVEKFPDLMAFVSRFPQTDKKASVTLSKESDGVHLVWLNNNSKQKLHIDINKFIDRQTSFPAPKQGAFNQALGKKTKSVIDCTGGWGGDALLMAAQGYNVTVLEQNPLMAFILGEAFERISESEWARRNSVNIPEIREVNASLFLESAIDPVDCLYLDPMFPAKRKKSASSNKYMEFLKWLLPEDADNVGLVASAANTNFRFVVKRPHYAEPLLGEPNARFSSKLVHYDVHFPR